jgi:hypothetical protein
MSKVKRVVVQTSFYVYVNVDDDLTQDEQDIQIMDTCDRVTKELGNKSDDVEEISMDKLDEMVFGSLEPRAIFKR